MALSGMTGFAREQGAGAGWTWLWEAKSVNGRGLDVRLRTPVGFEELETAAKAEAAKFFSRGSIMLNLRMRRDATTAKPQIDLAYATALVNAAKPLFRAGLVRKPSLDGLLAIRGVMSGDDEFSDTEREGLQKRLTETMRAVLGALADARREEGAALEPVLADHVDTIERLTEAAAGHAAAQPGAIKLRVARQLAELLGADTGIDHGRLAQEAAILAAKADVREELDRLRAHIAAARDLLAKNGAVGRRLDFLAQEFNREANTLCSKSADAELTATGLEMKAVIDQFREQIQNVE